MVFEVWAPRARRVELEVSGRRQLLEQRPDGWYGLAAEAAAGSDYAYILDGGEPLPDPRSNWQPEGVHGPSRLVDHGAFQWTDGSWRGVSLPAAVLYELHVGTFTPEGTFQAVIGKLAHLLALGVTAIELMPVAEFPGVRNWGYDGVGLYAPHHAYGGPEGLKRLVDACHARGLGVLLDVVYNHLGPEGNYLGRFGPYLTGRHQTPWGDAVDFGVRAVRDYVIGNALMWLRDYHIDGLRLDAVHAIVDESPKHILQELAESRPRGRLLVAESNRVEPLLTGRYGLDAQWNDDFHHALHVLLTGERQGYYAPFGQVGQLARELAAPPPERYVVFAQNHDQVGNRATGDRLGPDQLRLAAAPLLLGPCPALLFMGQEWGASSPFLFFSDHGDPGIAKGTTQGRIAEFAAFGWKPEDVPDPQNPASFERSRLDWSELEREPHRSLLEWHQRLIAARRRLGRAPARVQSDEERRTLELTRDDVSVSCDFGAGTVEVKGL